MDLSIIEKNKAVLVKIINQISTISSGDSNAVSKTFNRHKVIGLDKITKSVIYEVYNYLNSLGYIELSVDRQKNFLNIIKVKTVRTSSGVTPVTVMTKPYACPGNCIYCPTERNMPKSYIANEPGAQRAVSNNFDPYLQTFNRLKAYNNIGHSTDKVELIVIGGTWSYYPRDYKVWFIKRCFEALNDFSGFKKTKSSTRVVKAEFSELNNVFHINETSQTRCVGLSVETRPDYINKEELVFFRKLGVTKVQMGVQSLNNLVLKKNCRGHTVKETKKAFKLLRSFGFKIQVHWMPNLFGSDVKKDLIDYIALVENKFYIPDEIKIYPCSLIEDTALYAVYKKGLWVPYEYSELKKLLSECVLRTPRYCRISRMIRDISSEDILVGNRKSNLRQEVEKDLVNKPIKEIRFREIRSGAIRLENLKYMETKYTTSSTEEYFLEMVTAEDKIAGFLRLSLSSEKPAMPELPAKAIIREVHVYGESVPIGTTSKGRAQHVGVGTYLIEQAKVICRSRSIKSLAVISSVGTKEYYRKLGFADGKLYQHLKV